jgi:hypothetical protein
LSINSRVSKYSDVECFFKLRIRKGGSDQCERVIITAWSVDFYVFKAALMQFFMHRPSYCVLRVFKMLCRNVV